MGIKRRNILANEKFKVQARAFCIGFSATVLLGFVTMIYLEGGLQQALAMLVAYFFIYKGTKASLKDYKKKHLIQRFTASNRKG